MLKPLPPTMVDTMAVDTVMDTDTVWVTVDTMVDTTAMDFMDTVPTDTVTTWARGPLMPNLRPHPKPMLMLPLPTMVDTMAVTDTVLVDTMAVMLVILIVLTDTDTDTLARGLLMPNPMLMLPLMPTMDTMAVDTDTVMAVMVLDTDTAVKLLLKQQIFKAIFPHL